jgi:hypothetical protein
MWARFGSYPFVNDSSTIGGAAQSFNFSCYLYQQLANAAQIALAQLSITLSYSAPRHAHQVCSFPKTCLPNVNVVRTSNARLIVIPYPRAYKANVGKLRESSHPLWIQSSRSVQIRSYHRRYLQMRRLHFLIIGSSFVRGLWETHEAHTALPRASQYCR